MDRLSFDWFCITIQWFSFRDHYQFHIEHWYGHASPWEIQVVWDDSGIFITGTFVLAWNARFRNPIWPKLKGKVLFTFDRALVNLIFSTTDLSGPTMRGISAVITCWSSTYPPSIARCAHVDAPQFWYSIVYQWSNHLPSTQLRTHIKGFIA